MLDRELAILREAALISMEEKEKEQEEKELAALREAALHSARERKDSSDPLRKRRLKSPPSYHKSDKTSETELEEPLTPKMFENDSGQHTPTRIDSGISTVFHVKVNDNMLLKRSNSNQSDASEISDKSAPLHHKRKEDSIRVKVTKPCSPPMSVSSPEEEDVKPKPEKRINKAVVTDVSPVISKVSSVEDISLPTKKLKKKHKKHKKSSTSVTTKSKKREKHRPELSSEEEKPAKKSNSSNHKTSKKDHENGTVKNGKESPRGKEELDRYDQLEKSLKKEIINDIDSKIDKNIELLQRQKKHKHEHKASKVDPKKIISEDISSNEEEELLKPDKKRSVSPKRKDKSKKSKQLHSKPRSKSPSPGPDVSVSLMSKREFERMKAEMNKNPTKKPSPKKDHKSKSDEKKSKKKEDKSTTSPKKSKENGHSSDKVYDCTKNNKSPKSSEKKDINPDEIDISILNEVEELLKEGPAMPPTLQPHDPDIVSVMKEESFSDSEEEQNLGNVGQDKKIGDKKKKANKTKKKKKDKDKRKKKKRKKRNSESLSSSDEDSRERKKQKVKIDKSELNKIVQFLKQRDEAQKAVDGVSGSKTAFNPKLINKDSKPIEIKLKSKPKR